MNGTLIILRNQSNAKHAKCCRYVTVRAVRRECCETVLADAGKILIFLIKYKTTAGNILRSYKLIFHEQKTVFILKILSLTVAPILSYIILLLSKNAINRIEQSNSSFLYVVLCVSAIIVLEIVSVVYDRILFFFSDLTSSAFSERLRSDLLRKIAEEVPVSKLETPEFFNKIGTINAGGIESVVGSITTPLTLLTSIVYLAIAVYTSLQYNFYLYYLYIIILPFVFILETISKRHFTLNYDKKDNLQRKAGVLNSLLQNKSTIFDIKTSDSEEWLINETEKRKKAAFHFSQKESIISSVLLLTRDVLNYAFKYSILIYLVVKLYEGSITLGDYTLLFGLTTNFMVCSRNAVAEFGWIREGFFYMNLFYDFMDEKESKQQELTKDSKDALIHIKNLSFSYPGTDSNQLSDINCTIKKGEKIAILGYNGAGKTTLIKVLLGLYKPQSGDLYYDGVHYNNIEPHALYSHFTIAFQNHIKYPLTLKDNITFGQSEDNVYDEAISRSNLSDVIDKLPQKEYTYLNKELYPDGSDLSGGEWNKLILARSLYHNRDVLVFDEPLAAVDVNTEKHFIQTMMDKYAEKTVLIVSHRLSCIKMVDRIIVMNEGRIVEDGTHEELMHLKNHYFRFYKAQTDGFTLSEMKEENENG